MNRSSHRFWIQPSILFSIIYQFGNQSVLFSYSKPIYQLIPIRFNFNDLNKKKTVVSLEFHCRPSLIKQREKNWKSCVWGWRKASVGVERAWKREEKLLVVHWTTSKAHANLYCLDQYLDGKSPRIGSQLHD